MYDRTQAHKDVKELMRRSPNIEPPGRPRLWEMSLDEVSNVSRDLLVQEYIVSCHSLTV